MQIVRHSQPTFHNLAQLLAVSIEHDADRPLFGTFQADAIAWTTYAALGRLVDRCRSGLHRLGVGPGDAVTLDRSA